MTDLGEELIPQREKHRDHGPGFSTSAKELEEFFEVEPIREGISLRKLKDMGGFQGIQSRLKVFFEHGIDGSNRDVQERVKYFGDNTPIVVPPKTILELITEQFEDEILRILCLAAGVSLILGIITEGIEEGWLEGFAIFVAVIIIVSVTAGNGYMKDKQFRKLQESASKMRKVNVLRNSKVQDISHFDLVVGDILLIETGEILPVDGIVIQSNGIMADESSLTGEPDAMPKKVPTNFDDRDINPFLISGSKILEGSGQMIVLAVGEHTFNERQRELMENDDQTPLQLKLNDLADDIGKVGQNVAILVFLSMTLHLIIEKIYYEEEVFNMELISSLVEFFIIAVTVIVVAVPEGLPLAVTIALAYSVGKMKDENNLVRFLQACETMGGANNICSDKTGTLTKNLMRVKYFWCQGKRFEISEINKDTFQFDLKDALGIGLCVNANAYPKKRNSTFEQIGNKTECALIEMAYAMGFTYTDYRPSDKIKKIIPFSSDRKRMTTVWQQTPSKYRVFTKGAADFFLDKCTRYIDRDGRIQRLDSDEGKQFLQQLDKQIKGFAELSLRTILITYNEIDARPVEALVDDDLENDLIIIGLTGIQDPLRDKIPEAVADCKKAGIKVRMVTGDVKDTAVAIAKEAGILDYHYNGQNKYEVMTGLEFRTFVGGLDKKERQIKINEEDLEAARKSGKKLKTTKTIFSVKNLENFQIVADNLKVLARSTPQDKFLLVTGLKQLHQVVAVTGDGTNDAPALKKADVGFAMGIAGTEVAKDAAGIILLDDNFASIVTAIKWGRNIFDSIRKFLQFQVTVNIVAMFMVFLGGAVLRESPLNSIQMLWVNLIMDTLASLALATEEPTPDLLNRQPYGKREYMITPIMWRNIVGHAVYQIFILTVFLFYGDVIMEIPSSIHQVPWTYETGVHYTMFFNIFVFLQVFNEINARKLKKTEINVFQGFFRNPLFLFVIIGTVFVQLLIVEYGGKAVNCSPLTSEQNMQCIMIGLTSLVWGWVLKKLPEKLYLKFKLFNDKIKAEAPAEEEDEDEDDEDSKAERIRKQDSNIIHKYRRSQSIRSNKSDHGKSDNKKNESGSKADQEMEDLGIRRK